MEFRVNLSEIERLQKLALQQLETGSFEMGHRLLQQCVQKIQEVMETATEEQKRKLEELNNEAIMLLVNPKATPKCKPITTQPEPSSASAARKEPDSLEMKPDEGIQFRDIIGMTSAKKALVQAIILPTSFPDRIPEANKWRGLLFYGPSGVGKTKLFKAFQNTYSRMTGQNIMFLHITYASCLGAYHGDTERNLTAIFKRAQDHDGTCVRFFDEIDAMCGNREKTNSAASEKKIINHFLTLMDGVNSQGNLILVGTCNAIYEMDPAFYRRFWLVHCGLPDVAERKEILKYYIGKIQNPKWSDIDYNSLAAATHDFSPSDLWRVVTIAIQSKKNSGLSNHILEAMQSAKEEVCLDSLDLAEFQDDEVLTNKDLFEAKATVSPSNDPDMLQKLKSFYEKQGGQQFQDNALPEYDNRCCTECAVNPCKAFRIFLGVANRFFDCK